MNIIDNPLLLIIIILVVIIITLFATQRYAMIHPESTFYCRKILHIVSVGFCSFALQSIGPKSYLIVIFLISSILLAIEVQKKYLQISDGNSYGIALFPLAFALLLLMGMEYNMVVLGGYVLTFSDAFAGIVGKLLGKIKIIPFKEEKTVIGSLTFLVVTILILYLLNWYGLSWGVIIVISLLAMLAEMFSWRGSDNFTIIVVTTIGIMVFNHL